MDAHANIVDLCERATDADGNTLFANVYNERLIEARQDAFPYAIVLQRTGNFRRFARFAFGIETTVEIQLHIGKPESEENQALADLRDSLIEFILNDNGSLDWEPVSYSRQRANEDGGQHLYEVLVMSFDNDQKTYNQRG